MAAYAEYQACSDLGPQLDLKSYQSALCSSVYPINIEASGSARGFSARLASQTIGDLSLINAFASDSFRCMRRPAVSRDANDFFLLQLQQQGSTSYSHRGRDTQCEPFSLVLMDARSGIVGEQYGAANCLILRVPVQRMVSAMPDVEDYCGIALSTRSGSAHMLATMIEQAWIWGGGFTRADHQLLPSTLIRLLRAVLYGTETATSGGACYRSGQFARLRQAMKDLAHDPELTVEALADHMRMSRTTLYDVARWAGTSIERMLIELRLDAVEKRLRDPRYALASLSNLAYEQGFQNLSHFSRRFKERFGTSPSRYRQRIGGKA